jgi:hypothetical protein
VEVDGAAAEIAGEDGEDAGVAGGFVILGEDFEHDHAGPPVVVGGGPKLPLGCWWVTVSR